MTLDELAGEDAALDLVGTLADYHQRCVIDVASYAALGGVPAAAADADGIKGGLQVGPGARLCQRHRRRGLTVVIRSRQRTLLLLSSRRSGSARPRPWAAYGPVQAHPPAGLLELAVHALDTRAKI